MRVYFMFRHNDYRLKVEPITAGYVERVASSNCLARDDCRVAAPLAIVSFDIRKSERFPLLHVRHRPDANAELILFEFMLAEAHPFTLRSKRSRCSLDIPSRNWGRFPF
jgi:hypothetical protein